MSMILQFIIAAVCVGSAPPGADPITLTEQLESHWKGLVSEIEVTGYKSQVKGDAVWNDAAVSLRRRGVVQVWGTSSWYSTQLDVVNDGSGWEGSDESCWDGETYRHRDSHDGVLVVGTSRQVANDLYALGAFNQTGCYLLSIGGGSLSAALRAAELETSATNERLEVTMHQRGAAKDAAHSEWNLTWRLAPSPRLESCEHFLVGASNDGNAGAKTITSRFWVDAWEETDGFALPKHATFEAYAEFSEYPGKTYVSRTEFARVSSQRLIARPSFVTESPLIALDGQKVWDERLKLAYTVGGQRFTVDGMRFESEKPLPFIQDAATLTALMTTARATAAPKALQPAEVSFTLVSMVSICGGSAAAIALLAGAVVLRARQRREKGVRCGAADSSSL